eukprot:6490686-Amphidinium_carterae.3
MQENKINIQLRKLGVDAAGTVAVLRPMNALRSLARGIKVLEEEAGIGGIYVHYGVSEPAHTDRLAALVSDSTALVKR